MLKIIHNLATDKYKGIIASLVKFLLFIFSIIYGLAIRCLMKALGFNQYHADCKVISVGNITLGGTGKTPLVEYIAGYLKQQGHKVAIVTRGYKRKTTQHTIRNTQYENMGDEPYMLMKNLKNVPVIVDADRKRGIKKAVCDYNADTVVLDDGFQQWKIKKDLEVVAIDAVNPFGNRQMIPRGPLRQPLSSLKKADVFILTKTNIKPDVSGIENFLRHVNPRAEIIKSIHKPEGFYKFGQEMDFLNMETFRGLNVALVSGIAQPESFENLVGSLGLRIGARFRFSDHHDYSKADWEKIVNDSKNKNINAIITTQKDAVRLSFMPRAILQLPVFILRIKLEIVGDEERLHNRLLKLYNL